MSAAGAAIKRQFLNEEEERLTNYTREDLAEGWEFKIVRSLASIRGDRFARLRREEALNGWELVEKFDNYRFRFKRRIADRAKDYRVSIDPYRTQIGISDRGVSKIVLVLLLIALVLLFFQALKRPPRTTGASCSWAVAAECLAGCPEGLEG